MMPPMKRPKRASLIDAGKDGGLAGSMIPRTAPRVVDQRWGKRFSGLVDDAVLTVRGCERLVRVVNVSGEGAMTTITAVDLRIGEKVSLRLAGDIHVEGAVRWIRDGRMGINFSTPLVIED